MGVEESIGLGDKTISFEEAFNVFSANDNTFVSAKNEIDENITEDVCAFMERTSHEFGIRGSL